MDRVKIGLIRVVSFSDPGIAGLHGELIESRFPGLEVVSRCIPDQPEGIFDQASEAAAVPKIRELARSMAGGDGIRALIISCAADPAVRELRDELSIAVIGAGSAAAGLALAVGHRIGALGITEETPQRMREILGERLVAEARPEGVRTTLDLMKEEGRQRAFQALRRITDRGARVIALACTGFSTLGIAPELEKRAGIPVIDAVVAAGLAAWHLTGRPA